MTKPVYLAAGLRTPFARVDGELSKYDALAMSVPVLRAMQAQLGAGDHPDAVVWGSVAANLAWSNIAREVMLDAGIDPHVPARSTVLACSTSMVAAFEGAAQVQREALVEGLADHAADVVGLEDGSVGFHAGRPAGRRSVARWAGPVAGPARDGGIVGIATRAAGSSSARVARGAARGSGLESKAPASLGAMIAPLVLAPPTPGGAVQRESGGTRGLAPGDPT